MVWGLFFSVATVCVLAIALLLSRGARRNGSRSEEAHPKTPRDSPEPRPARARTPTPPRVPQPATGSLKAMRRRSPFQAQAPSVQAGASRRQRAAPLEQEDGDDMPLLPPMPPPLEDEGEDGADSVFAEDNHAGKGSNSSSLGSGRRPAISLLTASTARDVPCIIKRKVRAMVTLLASRLESFRPGIDIIAVLDTSGSMNNNDKISLLKDTVKAMVRQLCPQDRVSIVAFDHRVRRLCPLTTMTPGNQARVTQLISKLHGSGGTNMTAAVRRAVHIVEKRRERNTITAMFLLTDGKDDVPAEDAIAPEVLAKAREHRCTVNTFGLGTDHDAHRLAEIARTSGGSFCVIEKLDTVRSAFSNCLGGLLSAVGTDVRLSIALQQGRLLDVRTPYQHTVSADRRRAEVSLDNIYAKERRDIVLDIQLSRIKSPRGSSEFFTAQCQYFDIQDGTVRHAKDAVCYIARSFRIKSALYQPDPQIVANDVRVLAVEAMRDALAAASIHEYEKASRTLLGAEASIAASGIAADPFAHNLIADLEACRQRLSSEERFTRGGEAFVLSAREAHLRQRIPNLKRPSSASLYSSSSRRRLGRMARSHSLPSDNSRSIVHLNSASSPNVLPLEGAATADGAVCDGGGA